MALATVCDTNQWPVALLNKVITETAKMEQAKAAVFGSVLSFDDAFTRIQGHWLDAMMPAGNA